MKWFLENRHFLILKDFKICLFLIFSSIVLFSLLAFLDVQGELRSFDVAIMTAISNEKNAGQEIAKHSEMMRDITSLGGTTLITFVTTTTVLWLLLLGQKSKAVLMAITVVASSVLSNVLKHSFGLSRPDIFPHETLVSSATFPSGHTLTSAVTYLTIAFLIYQLSIRSSLKALAFCIGILISVWVGISRVYLGVHWPSDVVASWILAVGLCSFCWMIWLMCFSPRLGGE